MDGIGPVMPGVSSPPSLPTPGVGAAEAKSFQAILQESIDRVLSLQTEADGALELLRAGQATESEALVAFQRAQFAMETMMEIRNRIVAAYTEIQQMRV